MRRYTLAGIEAVASKTEEERKKLADEYRSSMYASDGRLKT